MYWSRENGPRRINADKNKILILPQKVVPAYSKRIWQAQGLPTAQNVSKQGVLINYGVEIFGAASPGISMVYKEIAVTPRLHDHSSDFAIFRFVELPFSVMEKVISHHLVAVYGTSVTVKPLSL